MINFAVVGLGHIGKRHCEMILRNPEARLVALCDTNVSLRSEFSDVPFFDTIEDLLVSGVEVDVVNVCTPNGLHASHSLLSLKHSKHVVCEKPMALHKEDCEAMINAASKHDKNIFCVMQNRYSPPAVWIKDLVNKKALGDIFMVQVNCYWNRDERYYAKQNWKGTLALDGGTLFTQFSHFVDMMYWLFGDIKNIQSKFNNFNHTNTIEFEDSGIVTFDFVNGGMGSINYSTSVWDTNMESSITIIGSAGSVEIGGQYMNNVKYCHIKNFPAPRLPESSPANDYGTYKGSAANHHFVIQQVVDVLKGRITNDNSAYEGLKVIDIIERIYKTKNL